MNPPFPKFLSQIEKEIKETKSMLNFNKKRAQSYQDQADQYKEKGDLNQMEQLLAKKKNYENMANQLNMVLARLEKQYKELKKDQNYDNEKPFDEKENDKIIEEGEKDRAEMAQFGKNLGKNL
jgi:hypothetical protein